jgi:L-alanine-DL-glutamate epimerase-like enolase superfamily enzyme
MKRREFLAASGTASAVRPAAPAAQSARARCLSRRRPRLHHRHEGLRCLTPDSDRPHVFVKLEIDQGVVGWGEPRSRAKPAQYLSRV